MKSEENRISINFVLHLSAVVLMHGSRVKVPQKSTLHFKYVEMSRRSRHRTTTLHFKYVSCHEDQDHQEEESNLYDFSRRRPTRTTTTLQKKPIKIQIQNGLLHVWFQPHLQFSQQVGQSEDPCTGWLEVLNGYNYQLSQ